MRCTVIDHTDDWDNDADVEHLRQSRTQTGIHVGTPYYSLEVTASQLGAAVDATNDFSVVLSPEGFDAEPVVWSTADVAKVITRDRVRFKCYAVGEIGELVSAIADAT